MKSRPAASCVGGPAWSKAQGSESCPVGVRRFKSCPTHLVETARGKSRGHEDRLNSPVESVGGGHHVERHPGGRQSDQIRGGTSGSPSDRPPRDGGLPSGRGPPHRPLGLSCTGPSCTSPPNRTRNRLRHRPRRTCNCPLVCLISLRRSRWPTFSRRPGRPPTCSSSAVGYPKRRSSQRCTAHLPDGRR